MYGNQLKQKRQSLGLTQAQLAKRLGVRQHQVSNWEREIYLPNRFLRPTIEAMMTLIAAERAELAQINGTM